MCGHPATRFVEETGFCFACHEVARDRRRAETRAIFAAAARAGATFSEAGGRTRWRIVGGVIQAAGGFIPEWHTAFVNVDPEDAAAYLAAHLESRSFGFGWGVEVLP